MTHEQPQCIPALLGKGQSSRARSCLAGGNEHTEALDV